MLLKISGNKLQLFKSELTSVDISASVLSSFSAVLRMCAGGRRFASVSYVELKAPRIKQTSEEKKTQDFPTTREQIYFFSHWFWDIVTSFLKRDWKVLCDELVFSKLFPAPSNFCCDTHQYKELMEIQTFPDHLKQNRKIYQLFVGFPPPNCSTLPFRPIYSFSLHGNSRGKELCCLCTEKGLGFKLSIP